MGHVAMLNDCRALCVATICVWLTLSLGATAAALADDDIAYQVYGASTKDPSERAMSKFFEHEADAEAEKVRLEKVHSPGGVLQYDEDKPQGLKVRKFVFGERKQSREPPPDRSDEQLSTRDAAEIAKRTPSLDLVLPGFSEIPKSIRSDSKRGQKWIGTLEVLIDGQWRKESKVKQVEDADEAKFNETIQRWQASVDATNRKNQEKAGSEGTPIQYRITVRVKEAAESRLASAAPETTPKAIPPFTVEQRVRVGANGSWSKWHETIRVYSGGDQIIADGPVESFSETQQIIQRVQKDQAELSRRFPNAAMKNPTTYQHRVTDRQGRIVDANGNVAP